MPLKNNRLNRATVWIKAELRVRNYSVLNTPFDNKSSQNVGVQSLQSLTYSQHAVVVGIKLRAFFVKGGDLGFFPTSRNTFLTQSNVKEVGQVRDNHIFIFLITWVSVFKKGAENSSKPGEEEAKNWRPGTS